MFITFFSEFFGLNGADAAVDELTAEFAKYLPLKNVGNKKAETRATTLVIARAKGLKRSHAWSAARCIRVGNGLRWRLTELGYPEQVAEKASRDVTVMAAYAGQRKGAR